MDTTILSDPQLSVTERIAQLLATMQTQLEGALQQQSSLRDFWAAQKECLLLFKETLTVKQRAKLWQEYVYLADRAKAVRKQLDEAAAFAGEQISLAIDHLDQASQQEPILSMQQTPELIQTVYTEKHSHHYQTFLAEIHAFTVLATRMGELKKELIQTSMRMRTKGQLFDRLIQIGDRIYPARKAKLQQLEMLFTQDIEPFFKQIADLHETQDFYRFREEIKDLQALLKQLPFDFQFFNKMRLKLSEAWDKLKQDETKQLAVQEERRKQAQIRLKPIEQAIKELALYCQSETAVEKEILQKEKTILLQLKNVLLEPMESKQLKMKLERAKAPWFLRMEKEHQEKHRMRQQAEKRARDRFDQLKAQILDILQASGRTLEELEEFFFSASKNIDELPEEERISFSLNLRLLAHRIIDLKMAELQAAASSVETLNQYYLFADQLMEEKERTEALIELMRKALDRSGLNFAQAMTAKADFEVAKKQRDLVNSAIERVEERIASLEGVDI